MAIRFGHTHIHQGGTTNAYCDIVLDGVHEFVSWEWADRATCPGCSKHFAPVSA